LGADRFKHINNVTRYVEYYFFLLIAVFCVTDPTCNFWHRTFRIFLTAVDPVPEQILMLDYKSKLKINAIILKF
jgi:hypothetical protein